MIEIRQLERLGYRFWLEGKSIRFFFEGDGQPDAAVVDPLLAAVRERRDEAAAYLAPAVVLIEDFPAWRRARGLVVSPAQLRWRGNRLVVEVRPERLEGS